MIGNIIIFIIAWLITAAFFQPANAFITALMLSILYWIIKKIVW